jgi:hypothetical protein
MTSGRGVFLLDRIGKQVRILCGAAAVKEELRAITTGQLGRVCVMMILEPEDLLVLNVPYEPTEHGFGCV